MKRTRLTSRTRLFVQAVAVGFGLLAPAAASARIPEPATWEALPLPLRLLQAGELGDLRPVGPPGPVSREDHPQLRGRFIVGLGEDLASPHGAVHAVSIVIEFATHRAARDQVDAWEPRPSERVGSSTAPLSVGPLGPHTLGVAFADGNFAYLIAERRSHGAASPSARTGLVAAATMLFRRVHGHPAPA